MRDYTVLVPGVRVEDPIGTWRALHCITMIFPAFLAVSYPAQAPTYKIVEIDRQSVFAGRLGDLVHETIVVERDGKRYTVNVRGDYHTRCVRPGQRLREGDSVRIGGLAAERSGVSRESIQRVRD